ncbi:ATP-grasp domain-containing protein [Massilia sp. P8910]|uniref:ATP-grasp domain-containing protein n=1 Tax=Massilia antarctica TaxID=2765360 RepID=UPI001E477402|nr:ATP-grasp domain-containing protein [Massilia antarctica]
MQAVALSALFQRARFLLSCAEEAATLGGRGLQRLSGIVMHWVIQRSIFKPGNFQLLVNALDTLGISYTAVAIPNGTFDLTPDVNPDGKVYVCGAIKLARIARDKGWVPGSLLNENFKFDIWLAQLGAGLLNHDIESGTLAEVRTGHLAKFFIRPSEDNKAFDGMVMDSEMIANWRRDPAKAHLQKIDVIVSPVKAIYREYRLFIVNRKVVTGSVYRIGGRAEISPDVEDDVLDYARGVIDRWTPAQSFVMDVCLTQEGLKVIEFNNINSSGFYAINVPKYVDAIQTHYG